MSFASLYLDEGNLLDFHDNRDAARASALSVVEQYPDMADNFGLIELDENGQRVGAFMSGAQLKAEGASSRPRSSRAA